MNIDNSNNTDNYNNSNSRLSSRVSTGSKEKNSIQNTSIYVGSGEKIDIYLQILS